jgi:hypothetical protein
LKARGAHMPGFELLDELIAASLRVQTEFGAPAD